MKKDTVIAIVLGVLLVISALQALQLSTLKSNLKDGVSLNTKTASTPAKSSGATDGGASLPASLENLPTMVGGC